MAAINMSLVARSEYAMHQLMKREKNWAQREPGVIVVLVIVFLVAILVLAMFINKRVRIIPLHPSDRFANPHDRRTPPRSTHKIPQPPRSEAKTRVRGDDMDEAPNGAVEGAPMLQ